VILQSLQERLREKMSDPDLNSFIAWFQRNHGYIDTSAMGFKSFVPSEGGRGAVALKDLPVCAVANLNISASENFCRKDMCCSQFHAL